MAHLTQVRHCRRRWQTLLGGGQIGHNEVAHLESQAAAQLPWGNNALPAPRDQQGANITFTTPLVFSRTFCSPALPPSCKPQICPACAPRSQIQSQNPIQHQQLSKGSFFSHIHAQAPYHVQPTSHSAACPKHNGAINKLPSSSHHHHASPPYSASICTICLTPSDMWGADSMSQTTTTNLLRKAEQLLPSGNHNSALHGWSQHVTWSRSSVALVAALGCTELLLLPTLTPTGTSAGTMAAEAVWSLAGQSSTLEGLLAASDNLEAVQAFSMTRKLGQLLLLDMAIRSVTRGKPSEIFGMQYKDPMNKIHGWYWWACIGLIGLWTVSVAQMGFSTLLLETQQFTSIMTEPTQNTMTSSVLSDWASAGDERTLPYRCRWWVETCVLSPVLEEVLFRGFVMASLTRYMPAWGALIASASAFAVCHLSHAPMSDLPQLVLMGCVLGFVYAKSRNLLAPIAAHSMHNTAHLLSHI